MLSVPIVGNVADTVMFEKESGSERERETQRESETDGVREFDCFYPRSV